MAQVSAGVTYTKVDVQGNPTNVILHHQEMTGDHTIVRTMLQTLAAESSLSEANVIYNVRGDLKSMLGNDLSTWWEHLNA